MAVRDTLRTCFKGKEWEGRNSYSPDLRLTVLSDGSFVPLPITESGSRSMRPSFRAALRSNCQWRHWLWLAVGRLANEAGVARRWPSCPLLVERLFRRRPAPGRSTATIDVLQALIKLFPAGAGLFNRRAEGTEPWWLTRSPDLSCMYALTFHFGDRDAVVVPVVDFWLSTTW